MLNSPRVPAIFYWKGKLAAGKVSREVAGGIDLFTTFSKLTGADISHIDGIDGKGITPFLLDLEKAKSPHEIFLSWNWKKSLRLTKGRLEAFHR